MLSEKQSALLNYLLKRIGYVDDDFLEKYIEKLIYTAQFFKLFRASISEFPDVEDEPKMDPVISIPKRYTIIDYLIDEIQIKKNKKLTPKPVHATQSISATDLASFSFCPASFAISNTWEIEPNLLNVKGKNYHERGILLRDILIDEKEKIGEIENIDPIVKAFFKDIKSSIKIFSGHDSPNQYDFFKSKKGNYTGQPDYIFKNKQSFFIVEEKFKFTEKDSAQNIFFENHKVQLNSYIHGLDHYNIDYGYLVYWYFNRLDYDYISLCDIKVLKLKKNETVRLLLNKMYSTILNFKKEKTMQFDTKNLNPNKCAGCACGRYCGHKTGRYDTVEFPYNEKYLKLYPTNYPEILKKKNEDEIKNT